MRISVTMSNRALCDAIENHRLGKVLEILDELQDYFHECILPEACLETLYELINANRRDEDCIRLSRKLERGTVKGRSQIIFDEKRYQKEMETITILSRVESSSLEEILNRKGSFDFGCHKLCYRDRFANQGLECGAETAPFIRGISSVEDLERALILFGNSIEDVREFAEYLVKVFKKLEFDKRTANSLYKLDAGLELRKKEILYHLYCIETEIPFLLEKYGMLDNQSIGGLMQLPCSPERDRGKVKNYLTKTADNGEIVCELHTKMRKIGSRKPDRIYFCACVPKGILLDGRRMEGKIYIYKITRHV